MNFVILTLITRKFKVKETDSYAFLMTNMKEYCTFHGIFQTWLSSHVDVAGTPTQAGLTLQKIKQRFGLISQQVKFN